MSAYRSFRILWSTLAIFILLILCIMRPLLAFTSTPFGMVRPINVNASVKQTPSLTAPLPMTGAGDEINPSTFREAEVLGLKLMQEQKYTEALKAFQTGMTLPGSRTDIIRTKTIPGPSPVGGGLGGFESKFTTTLDEFELQAVHYNMACAHAQLKDIDQAINSLQAAFEYGFDNFATVKQDPDLDAIRGTSAFNALMEKYEPKSKGFNPFGLFGGK